MEINNVNGSGLYGVVNGVYYCGNDRLNELNNRISERNIPSEPLQPQLSMRAVPTKYTTMPILDQRANPNTQLNQYTTFNTMTTFNPGTSAPWSGYATNINTESLLHNQFFALQKCDQSEYIPSSTSDLYNAFSSGSEQSVEQPYPNLFVPPVIYTKFNPNTCNIGNNLFDNFTRQQIKNLTKQ